jgi:hypothetical protein
LSINNISKLLRRFFYDILSRIYIIPRKRISILIICFRFIKTLLGKEKKQAKTTIYYLGPSILFFILFVLIGSPAENNSKTPTPTVLQTPPTVYDQEWGSAKVNTICLQVEQSYPQIEDKTINESIAKTVQDILTRIGLQVVPEGASCDATLTISVIGKADGARYILEGLCYTGAEYEGQVILNVPGREPLSSHITSIIQTLDFVREGSCHDAQKDAPCRHA